MKYIEYPILIGSAGVFMSNVPSMTNESLLHCVGVHYVRVGRNRMVLRDWDRDDLRRRPNL